MSKAGESDLLERTDDAREHFSQLEREGSRFRAAASRAVHNGRTVAQRWGRQTRIVAASATDRIKDDPLRSAAITFVIGLSIGAMVGRWAGRQQRQ
ncbi:MAG TPA: hypothetical protein VK208_00090 [Pyrinomonadaceae bacterium]|jgi:ElaB/YqjD/DUF883 family membrane-anchored ribosome-binding protein|nr:hypothetical protein [Pyrinomonadaceae bacterium]